MFIERHLNLGPGAVVLDVPCGSGRHSLALAERGYAVRGIDISTEAIAHARAAASDADLDVHFILGELRSSEGRAKYDAAICMGNSFGYLDHAGTREFVQTLATAVRVGGGLVIDFSAAAESVLPGFTGKAREMRAGDITVVATNRYDVDNGRLVSTYRFTRGDEERTASALHHVFTCAQIRQLLVSEGFGEVSCFGDLDDGTFELGSGRLLLTATRHG